MLITIAICTRNRAEFLKKAIRSVLPQLTPETELLVVDNASTDDTRQVSEEMARAGNRVGYCLEARLGLSAARNTALKQARGSYVLFLDDDAVAEPGWLKAYIDFLAQPPSAKIAALGGAVLPAYNEPPPKWIDPATGRFDLGQPAIKIANAGLVGANVAFQRDAAIAVGMFDERLGYKGSTLIPREESELQDRLNQAGWECWWLPGAAVQHYVVAERFTLWSMASSSFHAGRAAAIHRLKMTGSSRQRLWLRLRRLFTSPFHAIINGVQSFLLLMIGRPGAAVGAFCRVTRAAGWAWQMLQPLGR